MKKKFLLFTLAAGMGFIVLNSNASGPALSSSAGNRTGAKGSTASCATGSGCHSGTSPVPTMAIRVDSAGGVPVTQYTAGKSYTVTVMGKHATKTKFGFQFATVSGTGGAQVNAGTFSGLAGGIASHSASGLNLIEHTGTISAVSPADSFTKTFTWVAPSAGVGTITMYLTVNAVDGNGSDNSGDISGNITKTLTLYTPPTSVVATVANTISVNAFPNPAVGMLNVQVNNSFGSYSVNVFDITGKNLSSTTINANATGTTSINTSNWATGLYNVVIANENSREVIQVVKQ